jgi:formylmethanofuran dehydrogenase subunit E
MNDGLQAATGATLGRGSIKISDTEPMPAAIFLYKDRQLTLKLKKEIMEKIEADIEAALKRYGGLNREYFTYIRKLSLDYWLNLERRKIFEAGAT